MSSKEAEDGFIGLYHNFVLRVAGGLGRALTKMPAVFLVIGLIIFGVITAGMYRLEETQSITELWAIDGTRLETETKLFDDAFGGASRLESLMALNDDNTLTAASLGELIMGLDVVLNAETGVFLNTTDVNGNTFTLREADMCSAPTVPGAWRRTPPNPGLAGLPITASGGGVVAYLYQQVSECVNREDPTIPALPAGWGISRFPCRVVTVLDCFREGGFAYPADLATLQLSGIRILLSPETQPCIAEVRTAHAPVFAMLGPAGAALEAAAFAGLQASLQPFGAFGYAWRPSMGSVDIVAHVDAGLKNLNDPNIGTQQCLQGAACCVAWSGTKVPSELYVGRVDRDAAGNLVAIRALQNPIINANEHTVGFKAKIDALYGAETTFEQREDIADEFELVMANAWLNFRDNVAAVNSYNLAVSRSNGDIVADSTELDSTTLALGYIIMIVFVIWAFGNWNCPFSKTNLVDSHIVLGLSGVLVIALSTLCSFGAAGWFDILITPLNSNVLPFLALGLGLDDLFVLLHTFKLIKAETLSRQMQETWELAGPSILLTSLSNFTAFLITSLTPLLVIENFSYQMSIAVFLNFIFLVTLFGPLLVWDVKRQFAGRADLVFSKCSDVKEDHPIHHVPDEDVQVVPSDSSFAAKYYGPLLTKPLVKFIVVAVFGTILGLLAWRGFEHNEFGIRPSDIALEGSYQHDYINVQEAEFPAYTTSIVSMPPNADFTAAQAGLLASQEAITQSQWVVKSSTVSDGSWLNAFISFVTTANSSCIADGIIIRECFVPQFQSWVTSTGAVYSDSFACRDKASQALTDCTVFNAATDELFAATVSVVQVDMVETDDVVDAIEVDRRVLDLYNELNSANNNFAVGYIFTFWEQYIHIEDELFKIAAWSLLGVFIATLSFQFSVKMSLLLVLTILMIDIEVYGSIELIDGKVNGFSVANVVMSIGLSVEFCAHLARAFLVAKGTHDERMVKALAEMLVPITYGAMSSFFPLIPLAFSDQSFFVTYYFKMFSLMIVIAYGNGVILLPVMLSLFGPEPLPLKDHLVDDEPPQHSKLVSPAQASDPTRTDDGVELTVQTPSSRAGNEAKDSAPPQATAV